MSRDRWAVGGVSYPEHAKLAKVAELSQVCGEFLEWLRERYTLAKLHEHTDACYVGGKQDCGMSSMTYYSENPSTSSLLAAFFEVNEQKLEAEKREMVEFCLQREGGREFLAALSEGEKAKR